MEVLEEEPKPIFIKNSLTKDDIIKWQEDLKQSGVLMEKLRRKDMIKYLLNEFLKTNEYSEEEFIKFLNTPLKFNDLEGEENIIETAISLKNKPEDI